MILVQYLFRKTYYKLGFSYLVMFSTANKGLVKLKTTASRSLHTPSRCDFPGSPTKRTSWNSPLQSHFYSTPEHFSSLSCPPQTFWKVSPAILEQVEADTDEIDLSPNEDVERRVQKEKRPFASQCTHANYMRRSHICFAFLIIIALKYLTSDSFIFSTERRDGKKHRERRRECFNRRGLANSRDLWRWDLGRARIRKRAKGLRESLRGPSTRGRRPAPK